MGAGGKQALALKGGDLASRLQHAATFVDLPGAEQGNELVLHLRTKIHKAMSGQFWSYKTNPVRQTISFSYTGLNRPKIMEVRAFLISSAGKEILYTDHANRPWRGKMRTSVHDFVHAAIRNTPVTLEMEVFGD